MSAVEPDQSVTDAVVECGLTIPQDFICPLSQEIMKDPVMALDGHSYERRYIEEWFRRGRIVSPLTNVQLGSSQLIVNHNLRKGGLHSLSLPSIFHPLALVLNTV